MKQQPVEQQSARAFRLLCLLAASCGGAIATAPNDSGGAAGIDVDSGSVSEGSSGAGGTADVGDADNQRRDSETRPPVDGASTGADAPTDDPAAVAHACDHYFAAEHGKPCGGPVLPDSEMARIKALFMKNCANELALPGRGGTAAALEACATATEAVDCGGGSGLLPACDIRGSLPQDAPCTENAQCQSGSCDDAALCNPGGGCTWKCGQCAGPVVAGTPCSNNADCPPGASCVSPVSPASNPALICVANVEGGTGAPCDNVTLLCRTGLYCSSNNSNGHCVAGVVGDPCGECQPPLICGTAHLCQAAGASGMPCDINNLDAQCATGLGCVMDVCVPLVLADSGQPCDGRVTRCLVGFCSSDDPMYQGTCPAVLADGEPCGDPTNMTTCDTFSDCKNGVCTPRNSNMCP